MNLSRIASMLLLLLASPLMAQSVNDTIDVTITNVEVIVLDRKGDSVTGLTMADFRVTEDGAPVSITNFYAENAGAGPVEEAAVPETETRAASRAATVQQPQTALIYLDESAFSQPQTIPLIEKSLFSFFDSLFADCKRCSVAMFGRRGRRLEMLTQPTTDRQVVAQAFENEKKYQSSRALATRRSFDALRGNGESELHGLMLKREASLQTAAVSALLSYGGSLEGRKVLALLTNTPVFIAPDSVVQPRSGSPEGNAEAESPASGSTGAESRAMEPDRFTRKAFTRGLDTLVDLANATGIPIYPIISSGSTLRENLASPERHGSGALTSTPVSARLSELHTGVRDLAIATGGRMQDPSNNFSLPLQRLSQELRSYYSIGFRAKAGDRSRKIEVSVPGRPGLTVRARQSINTASEEQWKLASARFGGLGDKGGSVDMRLWVLSSRNELRNRVVTFRYAIDPRDLLWIDAEDGQERAEVKLIVQSITEKGDQSELQTVPVKLKRKARDEEATFISTIDLRLGRGEQDVIFAVRDEHTGELSWQTIHVP